MAGGNEPESVLVEKLALLRPHLDERQWRLVLGAEAQAWGYGGIKAVARTAGVSEPTVAKGRQEVAGEPDPRMQGRVRRPGAGRKPIEHTDPGLTEALEALIEPVARGDLSCPLRWTTKSTRRLAEEVTKAGHP